MKQKFLIKKDTQHEKLVISEYGELDKDSFSLLCEETFDDDVIVQAAEKGKTALVAALRTKNMYPPGRYADKIAESVAALLASQEEDSVEVFFNDIDALVSEEPQQDQDATAEEEEESIDGMLTDDAGDDLKEDLKNKKTRAGLKVADDEAADPPDES